jgi:hypothetical protein
MGERALKVGSGVKACGSASRLLGISQESGVSGQNANRKVGCLRQPILNVARLLIISVFGHQ